MYKIAVHIQTCGTPQFCEAQVLRPLRQPPNPLMSFAAQCFTIYELTLKIYTLIFHQSAVAFDLRCKVLPYLVIRSHLAFFELNFQILSQESHRKLADIVNQNLSMRV